MVEYIRKERSPQGGFCREQRKRNKKPRRKPKYGFLSCLWYSLKVSWKAEKGVAIASVAVIPVSLCLNAINLYLPTAILRELELSSPYEKLLAVVLTLGISLSLLYAVNTYISIKRRDSEMYIFSGMYVGLYRRYLDMDRFLHLDPETNKKITRAKRSIQNNHAAPIHFTKWVGDLVLNLLNFVLFGAVISLLNPLVLLLIVASSLGLFFLEKWRSKKAWECRDERDKVSNQLDYLSYNVSNNLKFAKDIRLYGFADYFDRLIADLSQKWFGHQKKLENKSLLVSIVGMLTVVVRDGLAYWILISKAVSGEMDPAAFVLYFSAITQISGFFNGIFSVFAKLYDAALGVSDYREFYDIPDKLNRGRGCEVPVSAPSIEFKNVSFKYPQSDKQILSNVSFRIEPGERIALVGENGAGKTTLTMLMCGLLIPDEGEVLINGRSVFDYNREELYSLFSLVPQAYSILPLSIEENITLANTETGEKPDEARLARAIELSNFSEKLASLPLGVKTLLYRQINRNAVDLSGGEVQRLLLARAIYRGAPILVLDEPTAALDPIAEDGIYQQYNEISRGCTSVFISHRLASTRFCDRIFFLEDAVLAETGSHGELMARNGKYREIFDVQSRYYREEASL
ncbi:MAG: ABC transporter ATP-binding protein [Clostridia bacterium]|nr:ABC transporter ATP-binding protein [Clostridia bacterium]